MKRIGGLILISGLMIGINSCQTDNFNEQEIITLTIKKTKVNVLDNIETVLNPMDINEYTINNVDIDDQKINEQMLAIAVAAREYFTDNSLNEIIHSQAKMSANKCFNLKKLVSINSLKSASTAYSNLIASIENADMKHLSTNPLKSGFVEEYVPAIHIVNMETADMTKQPIICPGFEVNSEMKGMEEYENYIVGWFYDKNDSLNEILLNEEMVLKTKHPVFVVDNAEEEMINKEKSTIIQTNPSTLKSTMLWSEVKTFDYQINHRYEGSGNSEFCIIAQLINESGTNYNCLNNGSDTWTEISEVGKSYIGSPLYKWQSICSQEVEPYSSNYIFWNTYERDWFNSSKSLGQGTGNGKTVYFEGNRKYSSEWYGLDPAQPLVSVDLTTVFNYSSKLYSNSKGHLKFYKYES